MSYPTTYKLDPKYKVEGYKICPDHLTLGTHQHNVVCGIKFHLCHMGLAYTHPTPLYYGVRFGSDLSRYVVDYSYDCSDDDSTRTSASVTLCRVPEMWQSEWVKREHREEEHPVANSQETISFHYDETVCFRLIKTYYFPQTGQTYEWDLGYFKCTNNQDELSAKSEQLTISLVGMSCMFQPEYGGTPSRATEAKAIEIVYKKIVKDEKTGKDKVIISNIKSENHMQVVSPYIPYGTQLTNDFLYESAMGSWAFEKSIIDEAVLLPIRSALVDYSGLKSLIIYEDKSFDFNVSRKDVLDYIIDTCYYNGHYWVDEDMFLRSRGQQDYKTPCIALYKHYGDMVIDEQRSYDDSGVYNCVVVTSNVKINDEEITYYGKYEDEANITTGNKRCIYIEDNNLRNQKECEDRAKLECWVYRWGHETFTVKLVDNYYGFLQNTSNKVGQTMEYRTLAGYSVSCVLEKVSVGSNNITLTLKPFKPIRFPALDHGEPNETAKRTLGSPQVVGHNIWHDDLYNYYVRLYVEGDDIDYGLLRGFEKTEFIGESCSIDEQDRHYIDMPVKRNGTYLYYVQLFSPYYENSGYSSTIQYPVKDAQPYEVEVTEVTFPETEDTDPYPHPIVDPKSLLINEDEYHMTEDNDDKLYTTSHKSAEM